MSFENSPVGINTLNSILLNLCKAAGIEKNCALFACYLRFEAL